MGIFDHSSKSALVRSHTDCMYGKAWLSLSIRHYREHVSTALESSGGVLYTIASDLLHCTCWYSAWMRPWKPIPRSSLHTVLALIWRSHEVWRPVAIDSAESRRHLRTVCLSIRWPRSSVLHGLPLRSWVTVIPNCFHFVIIPLTVDSGIFRSEQISRLDLLHRWHPITVPCWNSLSSWEQHILSHMFVETVCMPWCLLSYTCGHGSN